MKKIVALVLALVLALSLATVAFAAADDSYFAAKVGGNKIASTEKMTVSLEQVKEAGEKNVAVYSVYLTINGNKYPMADRFVLADEAEYDYVFVKGTEITYLKKTIGGDYTGEATLTAVVDADDAVCGDIVATEGVTLYDYDGKIMKAVESFSFGKAVKNAVKDVVKEGIEGFTLTKADWEKGVKDAIYAYAHDVDEDGNAVDNFDSWTTITAAVDGMFEIIMNVPGAARANYGDDGVPFVVNELNGLGMVGELWAALVAEDGGAFPWTAQYGLFGLPLDARDEVIAKVVDKLKDWFPAGYDSDPLNTDGAYNGANLGLNLVREFLKPACTIKAVALVDGKLVTLANAVEGEDYNVIAHTYAVDYATVAGKTAITKVYCETCGAEFEFVVGDETAATKVFGVGNYVNITNEFKDAFTTKFLGKHVTGWDWDTMSFSAGWTEGTGYTWNMFDTASRSIKEALDGGSLWISAAAAAAEKPADTGVTSADTFDAGIALYAGMALMSVTGSAIVIGKKKEF